MSQTTTELTTDVPSIANLSETERHRLLMNERRRMALEILTERSTSVELAELADEIAAREFGREASQDAVKRVKVSLHHVHLPQMDELDIIDYDGTSNTITQ